MAWTRCLQCDWENEGPADRCFNCGAAVPSPEVAGQSEAQYWLTWRPVRHAAVAGVPMVAFVFMTLLFGFGTVFVLLVVFPFWLLASMAYKNDHYLMIVVGLLQMPCYAFILCLGARTGTMARTALALFITHVAAILVAAWRLWQ